MDARRQMNDGVDAGKGGFPVCFRTDRFDDDLAVIPKWMSYGTAYLPSVAGQYGRKMATDKTIGSRDQYSRLIAIHKSSAPRSGL
jgi:hypothetical protein